MNRRAFLKHTGLAAVYLGLPAYLTACGVPRSVAQQIASPTSGTAPTAPTLLSPTATVIPSATTLATNSQAAIVHLLNRISYGPQPGAIEHAMSLGWDTLIEQQLHPDQIDDHGVEQRLAAFSTLSMRPSELAAIFAATRSQKKDAKQDPNDTATIVNPSAIKVGRVVLELQAAAILRAISSERQLFEIMVDFWSNHFNIHIAKGPVRVLKTADDRDVIRVHALGKFSDLLLASARSPAMLIYLDNAENVRAGGRRGGINENYARELMELHTVGVDGGYTQEDVVSVARVLTGWTVGNRAFGTSGEYLFAPRLHDTQAKHIGFLGLDFPAGGDQTEGETLLAKLAIHPKTAERLARKLVMAFVSDSPPPALVARAAQEYLATDTDIRATLAVILHSEEFRAAAGQKIKLPLRVFASAMRAVGAVPPQDNLRAIVAMVGEMRTLGQPLFGWPSPNGYPQVGAAWITTGGMLARWNVALRLVAGELKGVSADLNQLVPAAPISAKALIDQLSSQLLPITLEPDQRAAYQEFIGANTTLDAKALADVLPGMVGLMLASPEFQIH